MGASRDFSGSGQFVTVADNNLLTFGAMSFAVWLNVDAYGASDSIFGKLDEYLLYFYAGDLYWQNVDDDNADAYIARIAPAAQFSTGVWMRLAVTAPNDATSANRKIYRDGLRKDTSSFDGGSFVQMRNTPNAVILGSLDSFYGLGLLNGRMAYAQLWNRELTVDESEQALWRPGSVPNGLVGYWPLWGVNSPELDLSGNGLTGTVTGAAESTDGPPASIGAQPTITVWQKPVVSTGGPFPHHTRRQMAGGMNQMSMGM